MIHDQTDYLDWVARVTEAGVRIDLFEGQRDDYDWCVLVDSILSAAGSVLLCDEDLYPLLARLWTGQRRVAQWPPCAPGVVRRCATQLAADQTYEYTPWGSPTERSLRLAREAVIADLQLTPAVLLSELAQQWPDLATRRMPYGCGSSLLAFAEDTLLEPVTGACMYLWSVLETPSTSLRVSPAVDYSADLQEWTEWSILSDPDWRDVVSRELGRLGRRCDNVPADGDQTAMLLASERAADFAVHGDCSRVAASIVRTSGWPGEAALITTLAERAVNFALEHVGDVDPETDNEAIVDAVQHRLVPPADALIDWIRDPSFGRLSDGDSCTGAECLRNAAGWLTWSVSQAAVEAVSAVGVLPSTGG